MRADMVFELAREEKWAPNQLHFLAAVGAFPNS